MTITEALLGFVAAATILTITPGADTAMVLRSATIGGPRAAAYASLGIALGCLMWGAAVSCGLGALLATSPLAFSLVTWAGAAYLLWLGVKLILHPRQSFDASLSGAGQLNPWQSLSQGFLTNILNPKIGVFYISLLPQFVPHGAGVALFSFVLAAIHVALGLAWFAVMIAATARMRRLLRRPRVISTIDRATGGVFVGFAAKLALSR